jgi:hypothetical protein
LGLVSTLSFCVSGCVAAKHYDEARSVAETEMAGHQRTRARLVVALEHAKELEKAILAQQAELEKKRNELAATKRELDAGELAAAQSKLEATVLFTEKRAAGELVEQLRSELARTGEHMGAFTREKQNLQQALLLAEKRLASLEAATRSFEELVAAARDVSLALGSELGQGVTLGARDGALCLSVPAERLFVPNGEALTHDVSVLVGAISRASAAHPDLSLVIRVPDATPLAATRANALRRALEEQGIPEARISLSSLPLAPSTPAQAADAAAPPSDAPADEKAEAPQADALPQSAGDTPPNAPATPAAPEASPSDASSRYDILFVSG